MTAISLIEAQASQIPGRSALVFKEGKNWESLSWKGFWDTVCRTANGLLSLGVQKGENVGIFSQNSKDWIIFDIATQAVGAVTIPIYATSSKEQVKFIVSQAGIKHLLAGNADQYRLLQNLRRFSQMHLQLFVSSKLETLDEGDHHFDDWNRQFSPAFSYQEAAPDDLATIIYTSGTTGIPKGVMLTHKNYSVVIDAHKRFFSIDNLYEARSLAFLPLSHVFEREWTSFVLSQGGEVAVLEDPKDILTALKELKPTHLCSVPRFYEKVYQALLQKIEKAGPLQQKIFREALRTGRMVSEIKCGQGKLPSNLKMKHAFFEKLVFKKIKNELGGRLSFLPVGGAMLKKEISEFMRAVGLPVVVGYGLTETSATVTAYPPAHFKHGSVGKALPGVEIKIGPDDEILVRYGGTMKGYYMNEEETARVFTADGFLKTGDCGRIDDEGNLYITDRIKDLMKTSNGKYIAPQPIENLLQAHPDISQAMVVADGRPYAIALVVPDLQKITEAFAGSGNIDQMSNAEKERLLNTSLPLKNKLESTIAALQEKHAPHERIKKIYLLPEEFSIEKGELTPTLKIKRNVVLERLKELVASIYAQDSKKS